MEEKIELRFLRANKLKQHLQRTLGLMNYVLDGNKEHTGKIDDIDTEFIMMNELVKNLLEDYKEKRKTH